MKYSYPKEWRSPGWGRKDPSRSRGFNYSKERRSPGWGRKDPSRSRGFNYSKERRRKDPSRERSVSDHYIFLL